MMNRSLLSTLTAATLLSAAPALAHEGSSSGKECTCTDGASHAESRTPTQGRRPAGERAGRRPVQQQVRTTPAPATAPAPAPAPEATEDAFRRPPPYWSGP